MTNAARHSGAARFWFTVEEHDGRISFEARDNGRGAPALRPGNGLTGMRERLVELGGDLVIDSPPGAGLTLRGWIPSEGGPA